MSNPEQIAWESFKKGEKATKKWGIFGNKWEEAEEYYTSAGNKFKIAKNWKQAGESFMRAASCHVKMDSKHQAATSHISAAQCYSKGGDIDSAVMCYKEAISTHTDNGRFSQAAKYEKEVGDLYKAELRHDEAIKHYQKAVDYYYGEDQTSSANGCRLEIAEICASLDRFTEAAKAFEEVGESAIENNIMKFHVKEYFFKAMLCHLAASGNTPDALEAVHEKQSYFCSRDVYYQKSRECELIEAIITACEAGDEPQFTNAVAEFDSIIRLDDWKTSLLVKIKRNLGNAPSII
eukprot:TRINITY_DN5039_c0_g1_i1.p1 TRINITY_DN5039_c0_g1~~TRINITY_DN5039_c0_g1_i1.p1  ORF type:complete len:292 (-),score=51.90 TRINITY_DN5039_c0_g1_i1:58-933(-)